MIEKAFLLTQALSLTLIFLYIYIRTKDTIALVTLLYAVYFNIIMIGFKILYPDIPIPSPTIQYMIALTLVGIPFLAVFFAIVLIGEKNREKTFANINSIFKINKINILFWSFIIIFNLIGFILENSK